MYWLKENDNAYRAKYNGTVFDSWIDTGITTAYILSNPYDPALFPWTYAVPCKDYYETADLKIEWNRTNTIWSPYPRRNLW